MAGRWTIVFAAVAALGLAGCDETPQLTPPVALASGCGASASAPWRPLSGAALRASAASVGESCDGASATITVSDGAGRALYTETFPANHVMVLASAENATAMQLALADWIDQTHSNLRMTSELPVWIAGAQTPVLGEFPFYPEEGLDRDAYAALRARDKPLFCFVQGMESMACLALEDGVLTKVGVQTFPG